jgi:pyruvate kinase
MKAKLVWSFSGEGALKTAEHHLIHLKEYSDKEKVEVIEFGIEQQTDFTAIAFIIVARDLVDDLRQNLKPHKGFLVE